MQSIPVFKALLDKAEIDAAAEVAQQRGYVSEWDGKLDVPVPEMSVLA